MLNRARSNSGLPLKLLQMKSESRNCMANSKAVCQSMMAATALAMDPSAFLAIITLFVHLRRRFYVCFADAVTHRSPCRRVLAPEKRQYANIAIVSTSHRARLCSLDMHSGQVLASQALRKIRHTHSILKKQMAPIVQIKTCLVFHVQGLA